MGSEVGGDSSAEGSTVEDDAVGVDVSSFSDLIVEVNVVLADGGLGGGSGGSAVAAVFGHEDGDAEAVIALNDVALVVDDFGVAVVVLDLDDDGASLGRAGEGEGGEGGTAGDALFGDGAGAADDIPFEMAIGVGGVGAGGAGAAGDVVATIAGPFGTVAGGPQLEIASAGTFDVNCWGKGAVVVARDFLLLSADAIRGSGACWRRTRLSSERCKSFEFPSDR